MQFFQPPPITRYDLNFNLFGIPIRVSPFFWLIALLFASSARGILQILIWVVVIFTAILIHEMGHAFSMRHFGRTAQVVLYHGGGLTLPEQAYWGNIRANVSLRPSQEILVSLSGAGAGFLTAALIMLGVSIAGGMVGFSPLFGFIPFPTLWLPFGGSLLSSFLNAFLWINIFWGFINLMPVIPLDGGSIAQQIFNHLDPRYGPRKALWLSVITGVLVALAGLLLMSSLYLAFLFGLLAFQSFQAVRR